MHAHARAHMPPAPSLLNMLRKPAPPDVSDAPTYSPAVNDDVVDDLSVFNFDKPARRVDDDYYCDDDDYGTGDDGVVAAEGEGDGVSQDAVADEYKLTAAEEAELQRIHLSAADRPEYQLLANIVVGDERSERTVAKRTDDEDSDYVEGDSISKKWREKKAGSAARAKRKAEAAGELGKRVSKKPKRADEDEDDEEMAIKGGAVKGQSKLPTLKGKLTGEAHQISAIHLDAVARSLGEVATRQTQLVPLEDFPEEFLTNRSYADCELCHIGDSGRTSHSGALKDIYTIFDTYIGAVPLGKIYEMILNTYNRYVRDVNAQALAVATSLSKPQEPYKMWTFEMVERHFTSHEVNHMKMLYDMIITNDEKMRFTHSRMTYYLQSRDDGKKLYRHDPVQNKLWIMHGKFQLELFDRLEAMRRNSMFAATHNMGTGAGSGGGGGGGGRSGGGGGRVVGGKSRGSAAAPAATSGSGSGSGGTGGKSSAMSKLTQNAATRGENGFNNR